MARKPGSFTSGEIEAVLLVGPSTPATKRGRSGVRACHSSAASRASWAAARVRARARGARQLGRRAVQLARERLHAVVGERDGSRVERVRLDDVGAGLQVLGVDVA